jgi:hypothetical protein
MAVAEFLSSQHPVMAIFKNLLFTIFIAITPITPLVSPRCAAISLSRQRTHSSHLPYCFHVPFFQIVPGKA